MYFVDKDSCASTVCQNGIHTISLIQKFDNHPGPCFQYLYMGYFMLIYRVFVLTHGVFVLIHVYFI